ncbi:hypothetical protein [Jannaschia sp. 2305UL9-9]|uniref:hypothetical protein n=1 Tax=Jannaschia sp. 2305UL9-9 TaxID=3121638 RepID=UPI003527D70D
MSEATLARILYCWLNGELYSKIPIAIQESGGNVDHAIEQIQDLFGGHISLRENSKRTVSRQACHTIIAEVSLQVIVRAYLDREARLEEVLRGDDPVLRAERRRVISLLGQEPTLEDRVALIKNLEDQSIEEFITRWGKIVLILSANEVPHEAMRAIPGVKPFDLIQNPVILKRMQDRYKAFRGYKIPSLKTHIAHHFCLRDGFDMAIRNSDQPTQWLKANPDQLEELWPQTVVLALAYLLIQLSTPTTYIQARNISLGDS